jgi:hypothetical protein
MRSKWPQSSPASRLTFHSTGLSARARGFDKEPTDCLLATIASRAQVSDENPDS